MLQPVPICSLFSFITKEEESPNPPTRACTHTHTHTHIYTHTEQSLGGLNRAKPAEKSHPTARDTGFSLLPLSCNICHILPTEDGVNLPCDCWEVWKSLGFCQYCYHRCRCCLQAKEIFPALELRFFFSSTAMRGWPWELLLRFLWQNPSRENKVGITIRTLVEASDRKSNPNRLEMKEIVFRKRNPRTLLVKM